MPRFPIGIGVVYGLLKELSKTKDRPLLVLGALADQLARELTAGGDAFAVRTSGAPKDVEALVYVLGGAVNEEDERVLKLAHRARVPTVVVAAGRDTPERIPFVLATDVVRAEPGHGFPSRRSRARSRTSSARTGRPSRGTCRCCGPRCARR